MEGKSKKLHIQKNNNIIMNEILITNSKTSNQIIDAIEKLQSAVGPTIKQYHYIKDFKIQDAEYQKRIGAFMYEKLGQHIPLTNPLELIKEIETLKPYTPDLTIKRVKNLYNLPEVPPIKLSKAPWQKVLGQIEQQEFAGKKGYKILIKKGGIFIFYCGLLIAILWGLWYLLVQKKGLQRALEFLKLLFNIGGNAVDVDVKPTPSVPEEVVPGEPVESISGKQLAKIPGKQVAIYFSKELLLFMSKELTPYISKELIHISKEVVLYMSKSMVLYSYQPELW